jgi:hypothetical protein
MTTLATLFGGGEGAGLGARMAGIVDFAAFLS